MKKALLLTLVFVSIQCSILFSQINTKLVVNKLSPYLSDWMNNPQMMTFIVNNGSGAPVDCKIKMQLYKSSGDLLAETSLPKLSIITLSPGLNQFHADEICAIPAIKYYGSSEMEILKTGKVSEDNYNLCVSLINPTTGLALNSLPPLCSMFPIVSYQLPNNITPRDNEEIFETNVRSIIFRWSPVVPAPMYLVTYKLQIWEVPAGTNGVTAIRSFQPIVDKD
ncbi:MAG: hypothetical protein NTU43_12815, partial [Bacteroidetes bacterium]|nr:hypothetical protein [Bacteroidota bacterium]